MPPDKPIVEITLEEYQHYKDRFLISDKELIILHYLQKMVGDEVFMSAVGKYLKAHRVVPSTIDDFQKAIEEESGLDLEDFFHRWFETMEVLPKEWKEQDLFLKKITSSSRS